MAAMSGSGGDQARMSAAVAALWEEVRPRTLARVDQIEDAVVALMGGALDDDARDAARRAAHKLAGSLGTFGLPEGSTLARELERRFEERLGQSDAPALAEQVLALRRAIEAGASAAPVEMRTTQRDGEVIASIVTDSTRTVVEWQPAPTVGRDESPVALLAGERERQALEAASAAARSIGSLAVRADTGHRVAIVYPSYPQRDAMLGGAQAPSLAWQGELLVRLRGDSLLQSAAWAAADSNLAAPGGDPARTFVVARDRHGRPTVLAASDATAASPRLLLFPAGDAGSLVSAALITAATRAASVAADVGELERETIAEQTLANWRRAAASSPAAMDAGDGRSDGRWLWAVALVLLGVEGWIRRERRPGRVEEVVRERAA
jgi:HPt (histidine-containing phosphotransfer) domain-containing protein